MLYQKSGHGCGHNSDRRNGIAAGEAFKSKLVDQYGGKVIALGTPAEENFGGKVSMANAGRVFDTIGCCLDGASRY